MSALDPKKIIKVGDELCLSKGKNGRFDDNGLILGDVIRDDEEISECIMLGFRRPPRLNF